MDRQAAGTPIPRQERHLILAGYNIYGPQWGLVVSYVQRNAPGGPIAELYQHRNTVQLRRRVREAMTQCRDRVMVAQECGVKGSKERINLLNIFSSLRTLRALLTGFNLVRVIIATGIWRIQTCLTKL